jgi:hypothetical protein
MNLHKILTIKRWIYLDDVLHNDILIEDDRNKNNFIARLKTDKMVPVKQ